MIPEDVSKGNSVFIFDSLRAKRITGRPNAYETRICDWLWSTIFRILEGKRPPQEMWLSKSTLVCLFYHFNGLLPNNETSETTAR